MNKELEKQILAKNMMNHKQMLQPQSQPKPVEFIDLEFVELIYCNKYIENKNYNNDSVEGLKFVVDPVRGLCSIADNKNQVLLNLISSELITIQFIYHEKEENKKTRLKGISIIIKS